MPAGITGVDMVFTSHTACLKGLNLRSQYRIIKCSSEHRSHDHSSRSTRKKQSFGAKMCSESGSEVRRRSRSWSVLPIIPTIHRATIIPRSLGKRSLHR
jgi:hypothetical protein